jgi:hypothetical protein
MTLVPAAVVAQRAGLKTSSLARLCRGGHGPRGRKTIATRSYFPADEAERWLAERFEKGASEPPRAVPSGFLREKASP